MRPSLPAALAALMLLAGPPAVRAADPADCQALKADAARLACFDALEPAAENDPLATLRRILGDPEAIEDYALAGNSAAVGALLPGRWQILTWAAAAGVSAEKILGLCDRRAFTIAASERDAYALSVSQVDPKSGERQPLWDILWLMGSRFAHARNMEGTLAYYGLDPEKHGLATVAQSFQQAVTTWTYLVLSDDALLLISGDRDPALLMLRCPAPG